MKEMHLSLISLLRAVVLVHQLPSYIAFSSFSLDLLSYRNIVVNNSNIISQYKSLSSTKRHACAKNDLDIDNNNQYRNQQKPVVHANRRSWILTNGIVVAGVMIASMSPEPSMAAAAATSTMDMTTIFESLRDSLDTLQKLVDNWETAVIDCTYADVPRDLLETKNKELLLEKAKTSALFDKSASIVSCKTTNRLIRDYLGRTGKGPLVTLDNTLKAAIDVTLANDNIDDIEEVERIVQTAEQIQRDLSRADSLSYSARRDFTSMNNFDPDEKEKVLAASSDYSETKKAIQLAIDNMQNLIRMLEKTLK